MNGPTLVVKLRKTTTPMRTDSRSCPVRYTEGVTMPSIARSRRWPIDHVPRFDDVALNVTFRCDLACIGCNRACFLKPPIIPDMLVEDVQRVLEEIDAAGVRLRRVRIIGGEQTLHPDYQEIVRIVHDYAHPRRVRIRMFSNMHSRRARDMIHWTRKTYPDINVIAAKKQQSMTFAPLTRYGYLDPKDSGIDCPWPCPIMGGRGQCGYGVDKFGYYLCPMAGAVDTLLGLNARATTIKQMLDPDFLRQQAETICAHCGNFIIPDPLPPTWDHNGTPMSKSYHEALP